MRLTRPTPCRHGYTLTELLLAIVIVLGLVGAVVFNFSTVGRTAALDEGTTQVEALFRFARAHAASPMRPYRWSASIAVQSKRPEHKGDHRAL